ncbi:MAG: hypothetical protein JXA97_08020 [Anaerolineales bacterium]|nr:hypothetical protein [Anaerolineales bacterium]
MWLEALILGFLLVGLLMVLVWFILRPRFMQRQWQRLADELGGTFEPWKQDVNWPQPGVVKAKRKGHTVTLSTFIETVSAGEAVTYIPYLRLTVTARRRIERTLDLMRHWHVSLPDSGFGLSLPDPLFSNRYQITLSEPQDFAWKVFHDPDLRRRFHADVGIRSSLFMQIRGQALTFSTRARSLLFPWAGMEWRVGRLTAMIDCLVDVLAAAEEAPQEPWPLEQLTTLPEAKRAVSLGEPLGEFGLRRRRWGLSGAVFLGAGFALLLLGVFVGLANLFAGLLCTALTFPLLAFGVQASRVPDERVLAFEGGFTRHRRGKTTVVPWDEVEHIWTKRLRRRQPAPALILKQGERVLLEVGPDFPNRKQFMDILHARVLSSKAAMLEDALGMGKRLSFGPLTLDATLLHAPGRELPRDRFHRLDIRGRELLAVSSGGSRVALGDVEAVPDIPLLEALLGSVTAAEATRGGQVSRPLPEPPDTRADHRFGQVLRALHDLTASKEDTFVVLEDPSSQGFVQFLQMGPDVVLLDLPEVSLDPAARERACAFFEARGAEPVLCLDGSRTFQLDFMSDEEGREQAAETVVLLLRQVHELEGDLLLRVRTG